MRGAATDLAALDFTLDGLLVFHEDLMRTIIYVNTRELAQQACKHLQDQLPDDQKHKIDFVHALRTERAKAKAMDDFRSGKIRMLIATEVAGMVSKLWRYLNATDRQHRVWTSRTSTG